jgi:hypothetical protein
MDASLICLQSDLKLNHPEKISKYNIEPCENPKPNVRKQISS